MYIFKNALRSISRSKSRWILIAIIILVISVSVCISLSIRQAAQTSKEDLLEDLEISASIGFDRTSMMKDMKGSQDAGSTFDKDSFKEKMSDFSTSLTLEELEKYSASSNVKSFYYTLTSSVNGTDNFEAVDSIGAANYTEDTDAAVNSDMMGKAGQGQMDTGGKSRFGVQGDFYLVGYSSDEAMTEFLNGTSYITEGAVFDEGTANPDCIISEELAAYNSVSVGDSITLTNPNNDDEKITLHITGIYASQESTDGMSMDFNLSQDSANKILMSYDALKLIVDESTSSSSDSSTALASQLNGTYTFGNVEAYEAFGNEVYDMGLSEQYTVTSTDYNSYEQSITPIENLQNFSLYFLIIVLVIGAIILSVINIFNIRERKYEIGVMAAIGMKKGKIATQFIIEMLVVTIITVIVGTGIGAAASVPVGNALLSAQTTSAQQQRENMNESFGRQPMEMGGGKAIDSSGNTGTQAAEVDGINTANSFVSQIHASTNLTVFAELMGIAILLSLISSGVAVIFVLRYDPLKILSNRD